MQVTEHIDVIAGGIKIKRGIYRDFPTKYKDRFNNNYNVGFDVKSVLRNDYTEDYHTKPQSNGVRVYFGNKDRTLSKGQHKYLLRYTTNRQLGFFENHDELYWNVTGNDWDFPIDKASAEIYLPDGVPRDKITLEAYTGYQGDKGQDFQAHIGVGNKITFETTRPLKSREGLTIVVSFPKGYIDEPTAQEKLAYLFNDNKHLFYGFIGLLVLLAYYVYSWLNVGKDPEKGVVIPIYHPPHNYSPASMRFIERMSYDNNCFASAIINLAVKGFLTIKENSSKNYVITKTGQSADMAPGEKALSDSLFSSGDSITLKQSNHSRISSAISAHKSSLKNDYEKKYFIKNTAYFVIGILISIIVLSVILFSKSSAGGNPEALFFILWLTPWTFACMAMLKQVWNHYSTGNYGGMFGSLLFVGPFLFFEVMAIIMFAALTSISLIAMLLIVCGVNYCFYEWLKKPTYAGRKLLDKVEGFREYIELAEKQELDYKHPKGKSPELFEEYLPYALALNVEDSWARQFADVLKSTTINGEDYSPSWYSGRHWNHSNISGFTSSLNSNLSSAITFSSTAPGSSSGSGGGGFSGGGGGGGGGGGW